MDDCCREDEEEEAGGGGDKGPVDLGEVGANGSSKMVSVWALRMFICGSVSATKSVSRCN